MSFSLDFPSTSNSIAAAAINTNSNNVAKGNAPLLFFFCHQVIQHCPLVWFFLESFFGPLLVGVLQSVYAFSGNFIISFFLNFSMMLEPHMRVCDRAGFSRKNILPYKLGKWTNNGWKTWFFEFIEKCRHHFLLNLFYNENLHYLLCSCSNPIFGKIFVLEIWTKMFSANQDFLINPISRINQ